MQIFSARNLPISLGTPYYELFGMKEPHEWCVIPNDKNKFGPGSVERKINDSIYLISYFPIFHEKNDAVVYIMKDITETRRLKDQIYHMDKLSSLGTLTSGVAHEINNPLTGIIGYTEMLLMKDHDDTTKNTLRMYMILRYAARRSLRICLLSLDRSRRTEARKILMT